MAQVFDGFDTRLDRPVAIKLLRPEVAAHPQMGQRFEREARAAARLSHPNVVAVYDSGEDAGAAYLVMERLPGRTLGDRMAEGPMNPSDVAGVAGDVLAAMEAAHGLGMVHRDIKPGNILLTSDGQAKVADFGIAKSLEMPGADDPTLGDLTQVGLVVGTPAYLAPERLAGHPATVSADLYSLGVVMFEALKGHKPRPGEALGGGVPPALATVVGRALAPEPARRYPSAGAMASDLAAARAGAMPARTEVFAPGQRTAAIPRVPDPVAPTQVSRAARSLRSRRPRRQQSFAALAIAAIVVAGIVAAVLLDNSPTRTAATHRPQAPTTASSTTLPATTTTTTADPQAAELKRVASILASSGSPGASALANALQTVAATPSGSGRVAAAQQAMDLAYSLVEGRGITERQYALAASALEAAGATPPTTTTTAPQQGRQGPGPGPGSGPGQQGQNKNGGGKGPGH